MNYFSQSQQDKFINEVIFFRKKNGFFVDIGAYDGVFYSNTYFFEKYKNWNGVCFEPNPKVYNELKNNRICFTENCCVGPKNGEVVFWKISGYAEMLSGVKVNFDFRHISRIKKDLEEKGGELMEIKVPVRSLSTFEFLDRKVINYLSIDTEGGELDILKSIDFNLNRIEVISVEKNYNDIDFTSYLSSFGYIQIKKLGGDEILILKDLYTKSVRFRFLLWEIKGRLKKYLTKMRISQ